VRLRFQHNQHVLRTPFTRTEAQPSTITRHEELLDDYVPIDVVRGNSLLCCTRLSEYLECRGMRKRWRENVESSVERRQLLQKEKGEVYMRAKEVRTEEEYIEVFIEEHVAGYHITRGYRFG
jgi:hypothetical protein